MSIVSIQRVIWCFLHIALGTAGFALMYPFKISSHPATGSDLQLLIEKKLSLGAYPDQYPKWFIDFHKAGVCTTYYRF